MSEERMTETVETALRLLGVEEPVEAAGEFSPRGHSGSMFAGGLVGGALGGVLRGTGEAVGLVAGSVAGPGIHDAAAGLPQFMIVGVTPTQVCGFAAGMRRHHAGALVFRLPRARLEVKVHQRVNVRVLELVDPQSGSRIELEGNRMPVTHSEDVIRALSG